MDSKFKRLILGLCLGRGTMERLRRPMTMIDVLFIPHPGEVEPTLRDRLEEQTRTTEEGIIRAQPTLTDPKRVITFILTKTIQEGLHPIEWSNPVPCRTTTGAATTTAAKVAQSQVTILTANPLDILYHPLVFISTVATARSLTAIDPTCVSIAENLTLWFTVALTESRIALSVSNGMSMMYVFFWKLENMFFFSFFHARMNVTHGCNPIDGLPSWKSMYARAPLSKMFVNETHGLPVHGRRTCQRPRRTCLLFPLECLEQEPVFQAGLCPESRLYAMWTSPWDIELSRQCHCVCG